MGRELRVETAAGLTRIPLGQARSFGREADVVLAQPGGRPDPYLHGRAFEMLALDDRWVVSVPPGNHNPLNISTEDGVSIPVRAGSDRGFRVDRAELRVWTDLCVHRIKVSSPWLPTADTGRRNTRSPELLLDATDRNHRVWIVTCAPSLAQADEPSLDWGTVAEVLRAGVYWEDRGLNAAAVRRRAQRARAEIDGWMENRRWPVPGDGDRDRVVEFLVRFGAVTPTDVAALLPADSDGARWR